MIFHVAKFLLRNFAIKISPKFRNLQNSAHAWTELRAMATSLPKYTKYKAEVQGGRAVPGRGGGAQWSIGPSGGAEIPKFTSGFG